MQFTASYLRIHPQALDIHRLLSNHDAEDGEEDNDSPDKFLRLLVIFLVAFASACILVTVGQLICGRFFNAPEIACDTTQDGSLGEDEDRRDKERSGCRCMAFDAVPNEVVVAF